MDWFQLWWKSIKDNRYTPIYNKIQNICGSESKIPEYYWQHKEMLDTALYYLSEVKIEDIVAKNSQKKYILKGLNENMPIKIDFANGRVTRLNTGERGSYDFGYFLKEMNLEPIIGIEKDEQGTIILDKGSRYNKLKERIEDMLLKDVIFQKVERKGSLHKEVIDDIIKPLWKVCNAEKLSLYSFSKILKVLKLDTYITDKEIDTYLRKVKTSSK